MNKYKKWLIGLIIAGSCFVAADFIRAEDLTKFFVIASPQYIEQIIYIHEKPYFRMKAPAGWFLAKATEDYPGVERAFFCKSDPAGPLSEGRAEPFDFAYIKIAFLPNPRQLPAASMIADAVGQVKAAGVPVILQEDLTIDKKPGGHFVSAVAGSDLVMDTYIFTAQDFFISIKAICKKDSFESIKPQIKEAINSVKFK